MTPRVPAPAQLNLVSVVGSRCAARQVHGVFSSASPKGDTVVAICHVGWRGSPEDISYENFLVSKVHFWHEIGFRVVVSYQTNIETSRLLHLFRPTFVDYSVHLLLQTLQQDRLLSDNVVNPYFALLAARDKQLNIIVTNSQSVCVILA